MATRKTTPQRRPRNGGGLYTKTRTRRDPRTGRTYEVTYWEASWDIPEDRRQAGFARKRITGSGPTQSIALRNLEHNKEAFLAGRSRGREHVKGIPKGVMPTVAQLFEAWIDEVGKGDISDIVAGKYRGYFENHLLPYLGDIKVNRIDKRRLALLFSETLPKKRDVRDGIDRGPLLSNSSQLNVYRALSKFLTYAEVHNYIDHNPLRSVAAPKVKRAKIDVDKYSALADTLLDRLVADDDPEYCRWLMQFLGLRRAERLGLRWSDITGLNGKNPMLTVRGQLARHDDGSWYLKATKTGKERKIALSEPWISALRQHKKNQDAHRRDKKNWKPRKGFEDLVFLRPNGSFYTLNADNLDWHRVLDRHGLPYWRGHINRHVTASRLAATDPPTPLNVVYSVLGHDSDAISYYYSKVMERQQVPAMATYGATFTRRRKK
jgi:integrase